MIHFYVFTLFPELFPGPLGVSVIGRGLSQGLWSLKVIDIRDFALDKHRTVDDTGFGGGAGMILRADVLDAALRYHLKDVMDVQKNNSTGTQLKCIYFSPRGAVLNQTLIHSHLDARCILDENRDACDQNNDSSNDIPKSEQDTDKQDSSGQPQQPQSNTADPAKAIDIALLCGRFEGIDQRLLDYWQFQEISLGDFILSGGEIAAHAYIDSMVRLIPGVLGNAESIVHESFNNNLLEHSHYTRPVEWKDCKVPQVLLSGNHRLIKAWRLQQSELMTKCRRPDMWEKYLKSQSESKG